MFALALLCSLVNVAQTDLKKAQDYIAAKGEVCFTFTATNENQFREISEFLSIGHNVNRETLEIEAYATAQTFAQFLTYNLPYKVSEFQNEFNPHLTKHHNSSWDSNWNQYPTYTQYVEKMKYYASTYPNICTLETIGVTSTGRELLMLKISDNVLKNEAEPEFMYSSSMHGDELAGYPLMIRLIDYLLTNYQSNPEINAIVNSTVIYINPLANPDGAYRDIGNNIITNPRRGNANNQDLNRNYPDSQNINRINGNSDNTSRLHYNSINNTYEAETLAFMKFEEEHNIVLSANFHGGTELVNYAFDNTHNKHADHDWYEHISVEYATNCQNNSPDNPTYMSIDKDSETNLSPGVTNGAAWYVVYGSRQDYMNYYRHSREVTIELSKKKWVNGDELPKLWNYNKQAFLDYIKQVNYGFQGIITDTSGNPIQAKVYIENHDHLNSWIVSNKDLGDYYRPIKAGTYNVTFEAPGYITQNISISVSDNNRTVQDVIMIPNTDNPIANNKFISKGEAVVLTAYGDGTLNWYSEQNQDYPIFTGNNFTTPELTESRSYFVESVIALPNSGSTDNTSNGDFFQANEKEQYLVFNSTETVRLKSVEINAGSPGEIEVQLQDSLGNMIDSRIIIVKQSGIQDIDLNFIIPKGEKLRLVSKEMSKGFSLWRNTSNINYPYTSGSINIVSSNKGAKHYYFFYNWKIENIKSARQEVFVTVEDFYTLVENNTEENSSAQEPISTSIPSFDK